MPCALCKKDIDESSDSREHIIPNALGGRSVVRGFICRDCNSGAGCNWDSKLEAQLRSLALLFGVKRQDRKDTKPIVVQTVSGAKYWLNSDGTMNPAGSPYREVQKSEGRQIQISARSTADAKRKLAEVCAKYPQVNFDDAWATARSGSARLNEPLKLTLDFGGELAGRSIVKSALCLAFSAGLTAQHTEAHAYLREEAVEAPFGYYHTRDLVLNRPSQVPLHCVGVSSRNADGQLLGYVEYFGFRRMIVRLVGHYEGPEIHSVYSIDPTTGQKQNLDVELRLSRAEVESCFAYECLPEGSQETIMRDLMPLALKRSFDRERDRVIERAWREAMTALGVQEDEELSADEWQEFSRLMTQKIMEFVESHLVRHRTKE
jgi:hypothetical protein